MDPILQFANWIATHGDVIQGWATAVKMTLEFVFAKGPTHRVFGEGTLQVEDMKHAPGVEAARAEMNASGEKVQKAVGFGLEGLVDAGTNPTRQFVGSYNVAVYPNGDDTSTFLITNVTSFTSLSYHLGESWQRTDCWLFYCGLFGNVSQAFTWTEKTPKEQ